MSGKSATFVDTLRGFFRSQLDGPWAEELRAAQRDTFLARTKVLVWIAVFGMPTTCLAYVWFFARHRFGAASWMVSIAVAAVLLIHVLVTKGAFHKHYHLSMLAMVGFVFGPLASGIIEITRGSTGDFFFAFFMIYFSFTALYPAEAKWVLATSLVVISSLVLSRAWRPEGIVFDGTLISSLIYLAEMTFMATVMNRVVYQLFFDEKRSKLELAKANEGLRELDKAKSSFFHNISHEIRTPLTLILTPLTHVLKTQRDRLPADLVEKLEGIRGNANRLLKMVNNLLDFARLEAGQAKLTLTTISLDDLVRYVTSLFAATAENKGIELRAEVECGALQIETDVDKLEKILVNLTGNAMKFTPSGGSIVLRARRLGDRYELSVRDTGVGIPREHLTKIFERFVQLESANKASVRGTGIGLSMVQEYAKLLGGAVTVESEVDKGSTFTVTLPIALPRDVALSSDAPLSAAREDADLAVADIVDERHDDARVVDKAGPGKPRVLVVDDNPALVRLVRSILENDYNLFLAANGGEALARLRSAPVDLVVSDVMMPGMTGLELVQHIRADEKLRHVPVILLTARGGTVNKIEGLEMGADDYIGKPFDPEELKARVRSLFELRRTTKNLAEKSTALEEALRKLKDEELKVIESEKLRTLGELAAGMFHELHNYMNIVCNGAVPLQEMLSELDEALKQRGVEVPEADPADLAELAGTVREAAIAARSVTTELKGYAYQERGGNKPADLNAIVKSTVKMFGSRQPSAKIELELSRDEVVVECVPTRLTQVFTNLLKNAFEAMAWKGTVTIATRRENGMVVATVTDTGPGISEAQRGKLFEPFHTTKKQGEGLGLGLSLSRKVLHDLGGDLQLDASCTTGARFVLTIPAHRANDVNDDRHAAMPAA